VTSAKKAKPSSTSISTKVLKKKSAPVSETLELLQKYYPDAHCALDFQTPFQLLIATILSAQCTDERVNMVTPHLFAKYPSSFEMAKARLEDLEEIIRSTGFYKNKSRSLKACSEALVEKYHGEVPKELDQLVELAGVGRKTANVVLGNAYGITSGVVVDTHVTRLSNRLGWTKSENAVAIELDLEKIIPRQHWIQFSHWLITHGRQVCKARKPLCDTCFLFEQCPKILKNK
jgi:endonuclease-3